MSATTQSSSWVLWLFSGLLVLAIGIGAGVYLLKSSFPAAANAGEPAEGDGRSGSVPVTVQVTEPQVGGMERTTDQPGTVQAFESAQLYAEVPGFLKTQAVDIGDPVTKGQVLAQIDVPELTKQVQRHKAAVDQAKASVNVMRAAWTAPTPTWKWPMPPW